MPLNVASDIGLRLVDLRQCLGWTQAELGQRTGRGYKQVIEWEKGRRSPPRRILEQLAKAEGWPVEMFAEGGPRPSAILGARERKGPSVVREGVVPPLATVREELAFEALYGEYQRLLDGLIEGEQAIPASVVVQMFRRLREAHLAELGRGGKNPLGPESDPPAPPAEPARAAAARSPLSHDAPEKEPQECR